MLSAKEIAENLSFREFQMVCSYFDYRKAITRQRTVMAMRHGNGTNVQTVSAQIVPVKFDVLRIERGGGKLVITCRDEDGNVHLVGTTNLVEFPKQEEKKAA